MASKVCIKSDGMANVVRLYLYPNELQFQDGFLLTSKRTFTYGDISCVLLSPENVLSFQVKDEVFSIPLRRGKSAHEEGMQMLLANVRRAHTPAAIPPTLVR